MLPLRLLLFLCKQDSIESDIDQVTHLLMLISNVISAASGTTPTVSRSAQFGGSEGSAFDDKNDNICGIIGLKIRSGNQIDSIQVTYRLKDGSAYEAPKHGGNGGSLSSFTLADGEKLIRMEGMTNDVLIDMLTFYSNYNNVYGPYGRTGRASFSVEGLEIIAFFGRAGNLLDAIGVYVSQCDLGFIGNGTSCIGKSCNIILVIIIILLLYIFTIKRHFSV